MAKRKRLTTEEANATAYIIRAQEGPGWADGAKEYDFRLIAEKEKSAAMAEELARLREFRDLMLRDCGLDNPQRGVLVREVARAAASVAGTLAGSAVAKAILDHFGGWEW